MKKFLVILMVLAMTSFLFVGCIPTVPVAVTGVTLDKATLALTVGGATGTLVETVAPADASNTSVTWSSSAETVATVAGGVVTPVAAGTADITVTTVDGSLTDTCAVTVSAAAVTGTIISIPGIVGVTAPVYGAAPDLTVTASTQYTGVTTWKTAAGVAAGSTFEPSTVYIATITLTAKTGFTATGVTANFFTVAGAAGVSNPADSGVVTATFATTGAGGAIVSIPALLGVTAPVVGAAPDLTVTASTQYTGTTTWKTAAGVAAGTTFAAGTVYVATITLIPKAGFTFTGVTVNFFTVAGAAGVSNPVNSGVVTATYAATTAVPTVVSAVFTDSDTITITYSVAVDSVVGDYSDIDMVYPGASVLTPNQVDGTGTKYISITFTSASGVYAVNTTTGTIDIAATVVASVGAQPLVALDGQVIAAGGF